MATHPSDHASFHGVADEGCSSIATSSPRSCQAGAQHLGGGSNRPPKRRRSAHEATKQAGAAARVAGGPPSKGRSVVRAKRRDREVGQNSCPPWHQVPYERASRTHFAACLRGGAVRSDRKATLG